MSSIYNILNTFNKLVAKDEPKKQLTESAATKPMTKLEETMAKVEADFQTFKEAKKAKPDFLDVDKDGNKKETFKKAVKNKQVKEAYGRRSSYYDHTDQERREQDAMDWDKRDFKRREMEYELRHEDDYRKNPTKKSSRGANNLKEAASSAIDTLDAVFNEYDFYRLEHIWPALEAGDKKEALRQINHYLNRGKNRAWWGDLQALDIKIDPNDVENSQVIWSKPIQQGVAEARDEDGNKKETFKKDVKDKKVKEAAQLAEKSAQAKANKARKNSVDAERGASFKAQGYYTPDPEPGHKTSQAHDTAVGRKIRQMSREETELGEGSHELVSGQPLGIQGRLTPFYFNAIAKYLKANGLRSVAQFSSEDLDVLSSKLGTSMEALADLVGFNDGVTEGAKPDFLDLDKDGNKKEPMKKAAKSKKPDYSKAMHNMFGGSAEELTKNLTIKKKTNEADDPYDDYRKRKMADRLSRGISPDEATKFDRGTLTKKGTFSKKADRYDPATGKLVKQNVGRTKQDLGRYGYSFKEAAENPAQQRILDANRADLEEFLKTGYLDTTSDLYYQMYEYYADQMDPKVRRNEDAQYDFITGKIREIASGVTEAADLVQGQDLGIQSKMTPFYRNTIAKYLKANGLRSVAELGSEDIDALSTKLGISMDAMADLVGFDDGMTEAAAPGQEAWIKKNKARFIDQYGKKKGMEVLYATAWKRSKKNESIAGDSDDTTAIAQALDEVLNQGVGYIKAVMTVAKQFGTHPEYVVQAYEQWGGFEHDDAFDTFDDLYDIDDGFDESAHDSEISEEDPVFEAKDEDGDEYGWDVPEKKTKAASSRKVAGKAYGGAAQKDDDEEETTSKPAGEKRGRGRPKGSGKKMGSKGPSGKSKLASKAAIKEGDGSYRVTLTLKDDSAGPGETSVRRVNITVNAADEKTAIAQAKQKLMASSRYQGDRITGAKIQSSVTEVFADRGTGTTGTSKEDRRIAKLHQQKHMGKKQPSVQDKSKKSVAKGSINEAADNLGEIAEDLQHVVDRLTDIGEHELAKQLQPIVWELDDRDTGHVSENRTGAKSKRVMKESRLSLMDRLLSETYASFGEAEGDLTIDQDQLRQHIGDENFEVLRQSMATNGTFPESMYDTLYDYFSETGELPYGAATAEDEDPYNWIHQKLDQMFGDDVGSEQPDEDFGTFGDDERPEEDEMNAESVNESKKMVAENLSRILHSYPHEVKTFLAGGDMDRDLYSALFDYYNDQGEMPYGIAKGRDGDPYEWIADQFGTDLRNTELEEDGPKMSDVPAYLRKAQGQNFPLTKDQITPAEQHLWVVPGPGSRDFEPRAFPNTPQGKMAADEFAYGVKGNVVLSAEQPVAEETDGLGAELNELARLAGLKESIGECGEMSPFTGQPSQPEQQSGMSINTNIDTRTGTKTMTVTADGDVADQLAKILSLSGLGSQVTARSSEVVGQDVEQEPEMQVVAVGEAADEDREKFHASTTPDPKVASVDAIIDQGDDLNRKKKQHADKPKLGDNPMATENFSLSKSAMRELESIKIKK